MKSQPWPFEDERATNLKWRSRSCIERIIALNIRSTVNQRVTPNNMRPGSCIERITVSSLQTLYREGLLNNHVRSRSCIERITNLHWRCRSCIEGIITPSIKLTVNQRVTPNNMRPGSCIERITVSSLQALYREGLLSLENSVLASFDKHYYENACMNAWKLWGSSCWTICDCMCEWIRMPECVKFWFLLIECMHMWMQCKFGKYMIFQKKNLK